VQRICLLRHAQAVDERQDLPDSARYLSPAGRQQAHDIGYKLSRYFAQYLQRGDLGEDGDVIQIVASPLVRAIQTAELVAVFFGEEMQVGCDPRLAPVGDADCDIEGLAKWLRSSPDLVIVIGHEPGLSALGAALTQDSSFAMLEKAQACFIEGSVSKWRWRTADAKPIDL
jgi:phosphohistidine phosphatase SixA